MCRPSQECRLCETEPVPAAALSTSWVRLRLEFVVDADRAVMVGNNGNSDIEMHSGHHGFTFLEKLPAGIVQACGNHFCGFRVG